MIRDTVINCAAEDLFSALDDNSIGAVITDPPFFISTTRSGGGEFADPWSRVTTLEEALDEVRPIVAHAARVLRPGGAVVVMGQGIATTVWDFLARSGGLNWMAELTVLWNTGKPRSQNFGSLHTRVNWYSKPGARHIFNSGAQRSIYSNVLVCRKVPLGERLHPTEKPGCLTNFLVSLLTRGPNGPESEPDTIVDPFCGSGSTLVSAEICGRHWIGSDINPTYCSIAQERVDHFELEEVEPIYLWVNGNLTAV